MYVQTGVTAEPLTPLLRPSPALIQTRRPIRRRGERLCRRETGSYKTASIPHKTTRHGPCTRMYDVESNVFHRSNMASMSLTDAATSDPVITAVQTVSNCSAADWPVGTIRLHLFIAFSRRCCHLCCFGELVPYKLLSPCRLIVLIFTFFDTLSFSFGCH